MNNIECKFNSPWPHSRIIKSGIYNRISETQRPHKYMYPHYNGILIVLCLVYTTILTSHMYMMCSLLGAGIISVPVNMTLPGAWWKSGYSKALTAKEQLLKIIENQLKSNPSLYVC